MEREMKGERKSRKGAETQIRKGMEQGVIRDSDPATEKWRQRTTLKGNSLSSPPPSCLHLPTGIPVPAR